MKCVFITGGTGFFGKSMLDYRLRHPEWAEDEWTILTRNPDAFIKRHTALASQSGVKFRQGDVRTFDFGKEKYDAVIHAATDAVTTLSGERNFPGRRLGEQRRFDETKRFYLGRYSWSCNGQQRYSE